MIIMMPFVLQYLANNPRTMNVGEKELSEAEITGRILKIPFILNGKKYVYWTVYNRRAKSDLKYYSQTGEGDNKQEQDLEWCPWVPLTITHKDLKCDSIISRSDSSEI